MRSPFTLWSAHWLLGKMSFLNLNFVTWSLTNFCYPWCHTQVCCVTPFGFCGTSFRKWTLRRWYMFWLQHNHLVRYVCITEQQNTVINETAVGLRKSVSLSCARITQTLVFSSLWNWQYLVQWEFGPMTLLKDAKLVEALLLGSIHSVVWLSLLWESLETKRI